MNRWIIVADAARARIYAVTDGGARLTLVRELEHPQSRLRGGALVTDRPGSVAKSYARVPIDAEQPREAETEQFVQEIAAVLNDAAARKEYEELSVIAPPHLLGLLRRSLASSVRKLLRRSLAKHLTEVGEHELPERLAEILPAAFTVRPA